MSKRKLYTAIDVGTTKVATLVAKVAQADGSSIAEAAVKLGLISESELDEAFSPERVLGPAGNVVRPSDGTAT